VLAVAAAITDLKTVLAYQNEEVVARFCADHDRTRDQGEEIFLETKRWLWLCAHHAEAGHRGEDLTMNREMAVIDEMWHTFLLFTRDYYDFCHRYFGCFVHHQPTPTSVKQAMTPERRMKTLKANYEYIYDHLGADVLKRWCEEFPERYPIFSEAGE
jgi:hypothetical protein